jgi:hypothetical protein
MMAWMMIDCDGTWELDSIQRTKRDCIDDYMMHGFFSQGCKCVKVNITLAKVRRVVEEEDEQ